ncbi:MAG: M14 family zinc carboxypeptidase [Cyanobacteria bacterium J06559_3]
MAEILLNEGFDTGFPPSGWTAFNGPNGLGPVSDWGGGTDGGFGNRSVAFVPPEDVEGGLAEDWVVTPLLRPSAASSTFTYDARQVIEGDQGSIYTVRVSTESQTDTETFEIVETFTESDYEFAEDGSVIYNTFEIDLSAYEEQDIYVALVMANDDGDFFAIDDVGSVPFAPDVLLTVSGDELALSRGGTDETLQIALATPPTEDVTFSFSTDTDEIASIESVTFTPENWDQTQIVDLDLASIGGTGEPETTFNLNVDIESEDPDYAAINLDDVEGRIVDSGIPGFSSYRTVEETFDDAATLAAENPDLVEWFTIGESYDKVTPGGAEGYDISVLKLTNQNIDVEKPAIYIEGAIHAREYTTAELVTRFAEGLVAGYGVDPDATWLLDYHEIHIVPIANPDGRKFAEQGYSWRRNTNPNPPPGADPAEFPNYGVDLNRNFDFKWNDAEDLPGALPPSSGDPSSNVYRGESPASEPETQVIQDYVRSIFPDQRGPEDTDAAPEDTTGVFLDVHSFGNLVLHPWGWTDADSPNEPALRTLGRKYGYYTGQGPDEAYDVDESLGLYPTDGTSGDWAYGELGIAGYILELGETFFQPSDDFETAILPENIPALTYMAKAARRPYQTPAGPETVDVELDLPQVVAGKSVVLNALADDTRFDDGEIAEDEVDTVNDLPEPSQDVVAGRYSINEPSWIEDVELFEMDAADGDFDSSAETLTATIDTTGWEAGRYTLFVEGQDADGNWGVPTAVFLDVLDAPEGASITEGSDDAETLAGRSVPEIIYAFGGDDTVAGRGKDDILFGGDGDDILRGDTNSSQPGRPNGGDDIIYGGAGDDRIGGKAGDDKLYGDDGDDLIWGDDGDDLLWGGAGDDTLTGDNDSNGSGSDTFVLTYETGTDTITDFEVGTDFIGLFGTLSFDQLTIGQEAEDAFIALNSQTLATLSGVSAADLTESSFVPV